MGFRRHGRASTEIVNAELSARYAAVRHRVADAAGRSGRSAGDVTLVAVTKTAGPDLVAALAAAGHRDFGENRPQDLVAKREALRAAGDVSASPVRWHMIGHFQRNKVGRSLASIDVLHSLDSEALARAISESALRAGRADVPCYVQVNVSGEGSKGGFAPEHLGTALPRLAAMPSLRLDGLMTMAPQSESPEHARPAFQALRELRDWARASGYLRGSGLSMGMSEDFEVAIEEGATIVRVGRALLGSQKP